MKTFVAAALAACCISVALAQEHGQEPMPSKGTAPVAAKLISENDYVQIMHISIAAHEVTPMHDVTPRVVVWLRDAHYIDRYPDGKTLEESRKTGDAEWVSARRHSGENLSEQPMEFIAIVLKPQPNNGHPAAHPGSPH